MPTVARFNWGRFVVNVKDHNPPHVHVILTDGGEYRIKILSGEFIDSTPQGMMRIIRKEYFENIAAILSEWERLHPGQRGI